MPQLPDMREGADASGIVEALSQAMTVWDEGSYRHCLATSEYAEAIGRELGIEGDELEWVRIGSLLHDIGKMGVDLAVLKKPGRLEAGETELVRMHSAAGAAILRRVLPQTAVDCAQDHHEQPDGRGYPRGLVEPEIPIAALICRVADVLDSLTTDQTYRDAMSLTAAMRELRDGAGSRYSATVVEALERLIERDELLIAA